MSGVRDRNGIVHMPMLPGSMPLYVAHCDAIGTNHVGQTWTIDETVDEHVDCMHCITDVKQMLGLAQSTSGTRLSDALRKFGSKGTL